MTTEELYQSGKMPLRYYNQLNGKSITENYKACMKEIQEKYISKKELEEEISQIIEDKLQEIFKGLKFSI